MRDKLKKSLRGWACVLQGSFTKCGYWSYEETIFCIVSMHVPRLVWVPFVFKKNIFIYIHITVDFVSFFLPLQTFLKCSRILFLNVAIWKETIRFHLDRRSRSSKLTSTFFERILSFQGCATPSILGSAELFKEVVWAAYLIWRHPPLCCCNYVRNSWII